MEPGWRNDPFGRYQERWWDGGEFTDRVRTADEETTDPLGSTPSVPFAIPDTALPPRPGVVARFLHGLGPEARLRPSPRLGLALAGIGGVVAAAGGAALITGEEGEQGRAVVAGLVVLAGALIVRLVVRGHEAVRAAAVGAGAVGMVVTVVAATAESEGDTMPLLLLAAVLGAAWVLPGFRGRPLMLGLGAAALVAALVSAVDGETAEIGSDTVDEYYDDGASPLLPFGFGSDTTQQGTVALLCGAVLMGGVLLLDRRRWHGVATPLVPVGIVASTVGLGLLVADFDSTAAGALLATAVGGLVAGVGSAGGRRATTWWGAGLAAAGSVALVVSLVEPSGFTGGAVTVLCVGVLLVAVPWAVGRLRAAMEAPVSDGSGALP